MVLLTCDVGFLYKYDFDDEFESMNVKFDLDDKFESMNGPTASLVLKCASIGFPNTCAATDCPD